MRELIKLALLTCLLITLASCQKNKQNKTETQVEDYIRFTEPQANLEVVKVELFRNKELFLINNKKELTNVYKSLNDPNAKVFNTSIGRNREYVFYKIVFSDGFVSQGEGVLHFFLDKVIFEVCFDTDGGWMGGGPSLCTNLVNVLAEERLELLVKGFLSKEKKLKKWQIAKLEQEERMKKLREAASE